MKKVHCFPTVSAAAASAKPSAFFELCGSPIRTDVQLTYDDDDGELRHLRAALASPQTPPVGSPFRPLTQEVGVSQEETKEEEERDEEKDAKEEEGRTTRVQGRDGDVDVDAHDDAQQITPMRLANAQSAGIPCFANMAAYDESKTELPASAESAGARSPSHVSISMSDIQFGRVLGEGAFGRVYLGRWQGRKVAVKILLRQNLSDDVVHEFESEIKIMSYLNHPNICALLGACLEPARRALVVELLERGCLWGVLRAHRRELSATMRGKMVMDIARGMEYLHGLSILHRDMKSPNLLVEKDFTIKISDFGLARVKAQIHTMTGNCGTVQWMAPEVLGNRKYTEKADVYSFGIIVWEIFTGRCPYDGMTQIQAALSVLNHDLRPTIPSSCPRFFARLMKMCWARDPEKRLSFTEIVAFYERHMGARDAVAGAKNEPKPQRMWKP